MKYQYKIKVLATAALITTLGFVGEANAQRVKNLGQVLPVPDENPTWGVIPKTSPTPKPTPKPPRPLPPPRKLPEQIKFIAVSGDLNFGDVPVNKTVQSVLTISNSGTGIIKIDKIDCPSGFGGSWSGSLNPGDSKQVTISFSPTKSQNYGGNISITSDATSGNQKVLVTGKGILVVTKVEVTTLAGYAYGYADGQGKSARFRNPFGIAVDSNDNIYVADNLNCRIRKITPDGLVNSIAGSGIGSSIDGQGTAASFAGTKGIARDIHGNLYVTDYRIRKISPIMNVTTLAGGAGGRYKDGQGKDASFNSPRGVAVDKLGNLYVADSENHRIRKITSSGLVMTFAGSGAAGYADGQGKEAIFNTPTGVAVDGFGNLYVSDSKNHRIRKITPTGNVTTLAGSGYTGKYGEGKFADGKGVAASFSFPFGVALDIEGNILISDSGNNRIRKISSTGDVTTLAGSASNGDKDGPGLQASFYQPLGIAVDSNGIIYVADRLNNRIRKIAISE